MQLPDTIGIIWVYQMSQRNWMTIKVHYRYLRKYLLGWHKSRLGFVTPYDGEVSLAHSVMHHHNELNVTKWLVTGSCITERVNDLPVTRLNEVLGYRRSNLGQVTYRLTKGIVYGID